MAGNYIESSTPIMQNGDFYYPLTTIKQIIMEDGQRLSAVGVYLEKPDKNEDTTVSGVNADTLGGIAASNFVLKTDTIENATNADTLGGKSPIYYIQPRNLLDNSDFRNPVNQRGYTTVENGFIVDRWYTFNDNQSGGATLTSSGIILSGNGYLQQRLSKGILQTDKPYTFAVYYSDGTVDVGTNGDIIIGEELDFVSNVYANGKTISHVALYEGEYTADNLPPYVPKGYAVELAECMRYYQQFDGEWLSGTINGSGFCLYTLHLPVEMRVAPSPNYQQNTQYPFNVFGVGEKKLLIEYITPRQRSVNFVINNAENANQCVNSIQALTLSADL